MNEVMKAMLERRSCRSYKPDMVPQADIDAVIEAGLYAATGAGKQTPIVIAVTDKKVRDELSKVNAQIGGWQEGFDPFYGAPVVLIVAAKKSFPTYVYDGSLMLGNMMLAAHSLGLGSCWIHRAKEELEMDVYKKLLADLGVDEEVEGIGHCILGYADGELPKAAERAEGRVYRI